MGWSTVPAMQADIATRLGNKAHKQASAHTQGALDMFAMPVDGTDYFANKDFKGFVQFWSNWTNPDADRADGLQGRRHFLGSKLYPEVFDATKESWLPTGLVRGSDQDNLHKYLKGKIARLQHMIWWFNKNMGFNFPVK